MTSSGVRHALHGWLEKFEMLPAGSIEPTTMKAGLSALQGMFLVCTTPSLPAAITKTVVFRVSVTDRLSNTPFQPGSKVEPGTPSDMLTTLAPSALSAWTPLVMSLQLAVPVE